MTRAKRSATFAVSALLLTACADSTSDTPAAPATSTTAREIVVVEDDYSIALPEQELAPGSYTFTSRNHGEAKHDLVIKGPGAGSARTDVIRPGREGSVPVTLKRGEYVLWCSVRDHRDRGMEKTITVG